VKPGRTTHRNQPRLPANQDRRPAQQRAAGIEPTLDCIPAAIASAEAEQNRPQKPGLYRFYLAHAWSTTLLPDGAYHLEVEASDLHGNKGSLQLPFALANDL
jgi:hypothetical protein